MPLSSIVEGQRFAERLQRFRGNPLLAYGIAFAAIAVATALRWAMGDYFLGSVPFIFYFPAVVLATLLGGLGSGILAIALSSVAASIFFLHPTGGEWAAALVTFGFVALLMVGVVAALNWALDRLLMEIAQRRDKEIAAAHRAAIVESSPMR
jgi:K+-sensing histidine kinase KdpD